MRKNQKYSKEEMYLAIEMWQESGLSQRKFCLNEKLSVKTFAYWLRKYKQDKGFSAKKDDNVRETFIPVSVPNAINNLVPDCGSIEVVFPNGVHINCPAGIDIDQLKTLINF